MAPRKKQEAEETHRASPVGELRPQEREIVPVSDVASVPEQPETGPAAPVSGKQSPEEAALQALQRAKEAVEGLAAHRRAQRLSDTRARNVAREIREQIKVIRAYGG